MSDDLLANGTTEFRQAERDHANGRDDRAAGPRCRPRGTETPPAEPPPPEPCPVTFEFAQLQCVRPEGHPGPHKGPYVGLWFNDEGKRVEGGSAEDYA